MLPEVSCCSGWLCLAPGHAAAGLQHARQGQGLRQTHKSRSHAGMQHHMAQGMDSLPTMSLAARHMGGSCGSQPHGRPSEARLASESGPAQPCMTLLLPACQQSGWP